MQKLNDKLIFSCILAPTNGANFADAHSAQCQVWRDLNQDGVSDAGELFTLQSLCIQSLSTTSTPADIHLTQDTRHRIDQIATAKNVKAWRQLASNITPTHLQ